MSWEERIPPLRAALIQPVDRNETYSASALYAAALVARAAAGDRRDASRTGRRIGMGASLGALAMLHAHRRHPKSFDGLFLQSGSFFRQRSDKQESRVPALPAHHALRRHACCAAPKARGRSPSRSPAEPPRRICANNRALAAALGRRATRRGSREMRDAHNWTCWRDAFDPHLPALIEAAA